MKRTYFITFYLCFGVISLGLPQVYSTSSSKNKPTEALFKYAMQAYKKYGKIKNRNNYPITPKEALGEIKNALSPPPTSGFWLVSAYIHKSFSQNAYKKDLPKEITFLILRFIIVTQDNYKESTQKILDWATQHRMGFCFITDYLKEAYSLRCFYDKVFLSNLTSNLRNHQLDIYAHKDNFSDKELLLWLIKRLNWNVPTDAQIQNYQARYNTCMVCRMIRYKLKTIQALSDDDMDLYNMLHYYLLKGPSSVIHPPRLQKIRNAKFKNLSCGDKCLSYFFSCYWLHSYRGPYSAGGNVRRDICIDIGGFVIFFGVLVLVVYRIALTMVLHGP